MFDIQNIGRVVVIVGFFLLLLGTLMLLSPKLPLIGKLPGDFLIKGKNYRIYFPLASSLVISIILTLILNLIFSKK